jgi:Tfp pilus assembly protein PilP
MRARVLIYIAFFFVSVTLSACGGGESDNNVRLKRARPRKKVVEKIDKDAGKEILDVSVALERNPFKSYLAVIISEGNERVRTPLECCDLQSFKILGLISGIDDSRALVMSPDGKRYEVVQGDLIGTREGRIFRITVKSIIVDELVKNEVSGKMVRKRVELRLAGDDKIKLEGFSENNK